MMPVVFWLTGMPGAGKTTLAKALKTKFLSNQQKVIHLDGDELREALQNKDYSREGRIKLASSYARLSLLLQQQELPIIVSTVSLFHEVQNWNRQNIPNYVEVFLATSSEILKVRDQKQLYSQTLQTGENHIMGKGIAPEFPLNPDYLFSIESKSELDIAAEKLWQHFLRFCEGEV